MLFWKLVQLEKYKNYDFGRCPRVYCCGQPCLPVGQSDIPRSSTVKIYCPKCEDIYYPRSKYQGSILSSDQSLLALRLYCLCSASIFCILLSEVFFTWGPEYDLLLISKPYFLKSNWGLTDELWTLWSCRGQTFYFLWCHFSLSRVAISMTLYLWY